MRVLVYGAGRFGRTFAEAFSRHSNKFTDIAIGDPHVRALRDLPRKTRATTELSDETPDIIVITASAVPPSARKRLVNIMAPIEKFWDLERKHNAHMIKSLLPLISQKRWKILIIATNPVHEWVNALHAMYPNRLILGVGTAFDNRRIKALAAAMCPANDVQVLRTLKIIGGHGSAIGANRGKVSTEIFDTAKWMSNALSVAFIKAPNRYAELWWSKVAIDPLVEGISGARVKTHVVFPVTYKRVCAATGTDVIVSGLTVRPVPPNNLSRSESRTFLQFLQKMQKLGGAFAKQLKT